MIEARRDEEETPSHTGAEGSEGLAQRRRRCAGALVIAVALSGCGASLTGSESGDEEELEPPHLGCGLDGALRDEEEARKLRHAPPRAVRVPGVDDARDIALRGDIGCVARASGSVGCWRLGYGSDVSPVVELPGIVGATSIALAHHGGCASSTNGEVICWSGTLVPKVEVAVAKVPGVAGAKRLVDGGPHWAGCAFDGTPEPMCFSVSYGSNFGAPMIEPSGAERLSYPGGIAELAVGANHICVVRADRRVVCTGNDDHGELGVRGRDAGNEARQPVSEPTAAKSVGAGFLTSCALSVSGEIRCWGGDHHGQRGDGHANDGRVRLRARALSVGPTHACAIDDDEGGVHCWGANRHGQLGDGTFEDRASPVAVRGVRGAVAVATDMENSCAIDRDGSVWCWGALASCLVEPCP
jgi:hypothetical protein